MIININLSLTEHKALELYALGNIRLRSWQDRPHSAGSIFKQPGSVLLPRLVSSLLHVYDT